MLLMPGVLYGFLTCLPPLKELLSVGLDAMTKHVGVYGRTKSQTSTTQQRVLPPLPDLLNQQQVHQYQVSAGVSSDNIHLANPNVGQCFVPRTLDSVNTAQTHLSESDSANFTTVTRSKKTTVL